MTRDSHERQSVLFAVTLAELALLMFFIALIFAADTLVENEYLAADNDQKEIELEKALEQAEEVEQGLREIAGLLGMDEGPLSNVKDFGRLIRMTSEELGRKKELQDLKRQLESRLREERARRDKLERQAEAQWRQSRTLEGQLQHLRQECGPEGFGPPPCWIRPSTPGDRPEIDFIYEVTMYENGLTVEPAWPENREAEARSIPGAMALIGEDLSLNEFSRRARPVFRWSQSQEPECRLFVVIHDSATSKESFKRYLLGVENYFYKWLSPD